MPANTCRFGGKYILLGAGRCHLNFSLAVGLIPHRVLWQSSVLSLFSLRLLIEDNRLFSFQKNFRMSSANAFSISDLAMSVVANSAEQYEWICRAEQFMLGPESLCNVICTLENGACYFGLRFIWRKYSPQALRLIIIQSKVHYMGQLRDLLCTHTPATN